MPIIWGNLLCISLLPMDAENWCYAVHGKKKTFRGKQAAEADIQQIGNLLD